jgi:hypothetical protein
MEMASRSLETQTSNEAAIIAERYRVIKRIGKRDNGSTYLVADLKNNEEL